MRKKRSDPGACYRNDSLRKGDRARVVAKVSKYLGLEGEVWEIDAVAGYALFELPKGSKLLIEGRDANKQREFKNRKVKGELQSFPLGWLAALPQGSFEFTARPAAKKKI